MHRRTKALLFIANHWQNIHGHFPFALLRKLKKNNSQPPYWNWIDARIFAEVPLTANLFDFLRNEEKISGKRKKLYSQLSSVEFVRVRSFLHGTQIGDKVGDTAEADINGQCRVHLCKHTKFYDRKVGKKTHKVKPEIIYTHHREQKWVLFSLMYPKSWGITETF